MKKQEVAFEIETYERMPVSGLIHWHKSFSIEGERRISCHNFVLQLFKTTYWFSVRGWVRK